MGKDDVIRSLKNSIASTAMHKILLKHTSRPESLHHLLSEIKEYGEIASEKAKECNWNEQDKLKILAEALSTVKKLRNKKYPDIPLGEEEFECTIEETIEEIINQTI